MALRQRINLYLSRNVKFILTGEGLSLAYVLSPDDNYFIVRKVALAVLCDVPNFVPVGQ